MSKYNNADVDALCALEKLLARDGEYACPDIRLYQEGGLFCVSRRVYNAPCVITQHATAYDALLCFAAECVYVGKSCSVEDAPPHIMMAKLCEIRDDIIETLEG